MRNVLTQCATLHFDVMEIGDGRSAQKKKSLLYLQSQNWKEVGKENSIKSCRLDVKTAKLIQARRSILFFLFRKGPFIYYVITFLGFLDPPPPYVIMFLVLKIIKNWHFLTPLPPYKWLRNIWMVPNTVSTTMFFGHFWAYVRQLHGHIG